MNILDDLIMQKINLNKIIKVFPITRQRKLCRHIGITLVDNRNNRIVLHMPFTPGIVVWNNWKDFTGQYKIYYPNISSKYSPQKTANRAFYYAKDREWKFWDNCEHYVSQVMNGESESKQFQGITSALIGIVSTGLILWGGTKLIDR